MTSGDDESGDRRHILLPADDRKWRLKEGEAILRGAVKGEVKSADIQQILSTAHNAKCRLK